MINKNTKIFLLSSLIILLASPLSAHCEIPCGIYDDQARIELILEHITTIEKSMKMILDLETESDINYNQLVRWINNKEQHATEIQEIVSQYFLTQRIKPETAEYDRKLQLLHGMLTRAMKCKQTTDSAHAEALVDLVTEFKMLYFK